MDELELVEDMPLHSKLDDGCGHSHWDYQPCPDPNQGCGNYSCCQP